MNARSRSRELRKAAEYLIKHAPFYAEKGGHTAAFDLAINLTTGFDLAEDEALALMQEHYNPHCHPQWSEKDLRDKIQAARLQKKEWDRRNRAADRINRRKKAAKKAKAEAAARP